MAFAPLTRDTIKAQEVQYWRVGNTLGKRSGASGTAKEAY